MRSEWPRPLRLGRPGNGGSATRTGDLVAQEDDHVLPRLRQLDAQALIVVGGSTGAAKSTLVKSLVGAVVSPAGAPADDSRSVLACHPADVRWFEDDRVLPGLREV